MHIREISYSYLRDHELAQVEAYNSLNTDPYQVLHNKTMALAEDLGITEAEAEVLLLTDNDPWS